jgi:hypothetical protein
MQAILKFTLPEEQGEYDAARLGRDALGTLANIERHCRAVVKHGDPSEETAALAEAIRAMIDRELLEV